MTEWIKYSEKKPKENDFIVLRRVLSEKHHPDWHVYFRVMFYTSCYEKLKDPNYVITHWAELPEVPHD